MRCTKENNIKTSFFYHHEEIDGKPSRLDGWAYQFYGPDGRRYVIFYRAKTRTEARHLHQEVLRS